MLFSPVSHFEMSLRSLIIMLVLLLMKCNLGGAVFSYHKKCGIEKQSFMGSFGTC